ADVDLRSTHSRGGHSRGPPPRVRRNRGARGSGARPADPTVREPRHGLGTDEHLDERSGSLSGPRGGRQRDVEPHVLRRQSAQLVHRLQQQLRRRRDRDILRSRRSPNDPTHLEDRRPRSLLTPRLHAIRVTRLSDIGERGAIEILARIYDRGQPIGLGHDCGVVEWGDDYLVVTTDVVNQKTHVPPGAAPTQIGWYATAVNLSDTAAAGARPLGFVPA